MNILWGLVGMLGLLAIAVLFSTNRRAIKPRIVVAALALQVGFGVLVLFVPPGRAALAAAAGAVQAVIDSSRAGIGFLFGPLIPENGVIFAFQVLPVIVFFASLMSVLYHLGWLQKVVQVIGGALSWLIGTERIVSVNAAANIFVGQTEAPLVIRPYIKGLSRSGLFAVMVGGLSTVAGSVLVGYSLLGASLDYLIAAAFMAAPGALLMASIMVPEDGTMNCDKPEGKKGWFGRGSKSSQAQAEAEAGTAAAGSRGATTAVRDEEADAVADSDPEANPEAKSPEETTEEELDAVKHRNLIDAAAAGASDGMMLALNIGAMLLAFISLIALLNLLLGGVAGWFGYGDLTFETILGYLFAPIMAMIGVPWGEAVSAGTFVGQKIVLNEFVAFSQFGPVVDTFTPKTAAIITFALTGFANLGSLGILLGGLGGLAPTRRSDIAALGMRAVLAGTLANLMSAAIAGMLT
ncbi:CNT family concentrative nucleoside transporter [Kineosphaera limosa]|uniref:Putative nucleoside transporter n=1 Tax=Kineosphaera limosa NBRC 100340 TaxID=1184609 RepID=K6W7L2_9MICO|nr:nucleoside transporter C-terminal domain-containing protein [Kineosphaera limosa]NYE01434.1 CNT family concentrative nucleoside transporter [Kineosphaera limosa]GAB95180.1 putative nucleoside transporter [Kineosphaera limosa NBRC 100340]